jgi:hypothetical protein
VLERRAAVETETGKAQDGELHGQHIARFEHFAVGDTLRQAHEAAEKQDWDAAIGLLSAALRALDFGGAAAVKQNLAVCYGARAVAHVNRLTGNRYADPAATTDMRRRSTVKL